MPRRPRKPPDRSAYDVLGVAPDADAETIRAAHRALAKRLHPDAGGSLEAMQRLNVAQQVALEALQRAPEAGRTASPASSSGRPPSRRRTSERPASSPFRGGVRRDHPSFTIEALPAVAFEGLVLAARLIGEVTDDDPPYLLQAVLDAPDGCWSQLELVPDAGSTTVSLTVGRTAAGPPLDVDAVRDRWIAALNRLDWSDPTAPQPPS